MSVLWRPCKPEGEALAKAIVASIATGYRKNP
jgi:hypothetical protein